MKIDFIGRSFETVFGNHVLYTIKTQIKGFNILDDFGGGRGHLRTRVTINGTNKHVYIKDYCFNQDFLCKRN